MTFHIGQKVVCVIAADPYGRPPIVKVGGIYTVTSVGQWLDQLEFLTFAEVSPGSAPGWASRAFRPLVEKKTDISIFHAILNGAPVKEVV